MEKDHLVVILERMESKLELVAEGHEVLRSEIQALAKKTDERFDLVDFKINTLNQKIDKVSSELNQKIDNVASELNQKIDNVAADLKAHRRDTEAHPRGYRVREGEA